MKELFKLQNDKEKTRIEIFDFFRGSAVMLVLLHHVGIPYGRYILAFHMPLFFILSGYLYKKRNTIESRGFADFIKQKARRILVPYFGFELIIMCLSMICVRNNFNLLQNVKSILLCINLNTSAGIVLRLWFLPCIFVSEIYFYIVNKGLKNSKVRYLVPLFFFAASKVFNIITDARLPFTLDVSLMGTGFICCGYYFYDVVERIGRKMNKIQNVICNAVLMIVYILSTYRTATACVHGAQGFWAGTAAMRECQRHSPAAFMVPVRTGTDFAPFGQRRKIPKHRHQGRAQRRTPQPQ